MKIFKINLSNVRGYSEAQIELSSGINIVVGENNSGKTTILRTLLFLQDTSLFQPIDIRVRESQASITLTFDGGLRQYLLPQILSNVSFHDLSDREINVTFTNTTLRLNNIDLASLSASTDGLCYETVWGGCYILPQEPKNFIYPFLSKRKVEKYNEGINDHFANSITGDFTNLSSKVDRISADGLTEKDEYQNACQEILGFRISSYPSANGKKAMYIVDNIQQIPLEQMGEGVANILGLILDLCWAKDKLFLIEEPENDIHPRALKKLLELIVKKSESNQFVITTHSNIVLKYLGADPSTKIFKTSMEFVDRVPTSSITEIENSPPARREILEDLGYELLDFDVWDTWLILEESSAEVVIRDFLIPNFVPSLKERLRTCSGGSVTNVSARIGAIYNLCLFLHLQKTFDDRIWVLVDGGDDEAKIIDKLKNKYKSWNQDRFCQFKQHDFEKYYPEIFQARVDEVLLIQDKDEKRKAKASLIEEVKSWFKANKALAIEAFGKSASEVIEILKEIEKSVEDRNI